MEAILDFKILLVVLTYKLWWPIFLVIWQAVNPYPGVLTPKDLDGTADDGPVLDPLLSEEWAVWRRRRLEEKQAEQQGQSSKPTRKAKPDKVRHVGSRGLRRAG